MLDRLQTWVKNFKGEKLLLWERIALIYFLPFAVLIWAGEHQRRCWYDWIRRRPDVLKWHEEAEAKLAAAEAELPKEPQYREDGTEVDDGIFRLGPCETEYHIRDTYLRYHRVHRIQSGVRSLYSRFWSFMVKYVAVGGIVIPVAVLGWWLWAHVALSVSIDWK